MPSETSDGSMIRFEHVHKAYDGAPRGAGAGAGAPRAAVEDISFSVRPGELLVVVGPSGCGKSTMLRMANRLVEPTSGRILVDGVDVLAADPVRLRRSIGYVIQEVGLFPHLTVGQNVGTVPRLLRWDRARTAERVDELLGLVGLDPGRYARRYPHQLSGGERQRVGVARALAVRPPVLLMDEPFGAVDPVGRRRLQDEFLKLHRELGTTVMLVTHDVDEAIRMADRVLVLSRGAKVEQLAPPLEVVARPATPAVADLVGTGRAARLLGVGHLGRRDLVAVGPEDRDAPRVDLAADLGSVLAALVPAARGRVVLTEGGTEVGAADAAALVRALRRLTDGGVDHVAAGGRVGTLPA
ncbi:ABC transporter ATP-binding protein [Cellulomonas endophytica]|uniref:ABC transporter ATP-binding protein n=1 Tax=Cellulomonas endophytica TaxID=2494735 RepID=UPI001F0C77B5|nr:ATP-binding cassette domain-containing protein [Cellulomonas endophytica]